MCRLAIAKGALLDYSELFNRVSSKDVNAYLNFISKIKYKIETQIAPAGTAAPPVNLSDKPKEMSDPFNEVVAMVNLRWFDGRTPLMMAIAQENIELVLFLLDEGASVNYQNSSGWTALHETAFLSRKNPVLAMDILEILISRGADPLLQSHCK